MTDDMMDGEEHDTTNQMDHGHHNMDHNDSGMDTMDDMSHDNMSMGTIMYMDGFHSALFSSSETPPPCLNLFYPTWTLDSEEKFVIAMFFIAMLGVLVEGCGVWRVKCLRKGRHIRRRERIKRMQRQHNNEQQQEFLENASQVNPSRRSSAPSLLCPSILHRTWRFLVPRFIRDAVIKCFNINTGDASKQIKRYEIMAASLHAMRAWLGYLLMLAVMSYAIEFLVCTIAGLVLGRYWFIETEGDGLVVSGAADQESSNNFQGGDGMWGGGDPCCGIDDDDEDFSTNDNIDDATSEVETRLMQTEASDSNINEPLLGSSLSRRNVS
jgi:hypothetical protein